jgi:hypothetical protein
MIVGPLFLSAIFLLVANTVARSGLHPAVRGITIPVALGAAFVAWIFPLMWLNGLLILVVGVACGRHHRWRLWGTLTATVVLYAIVGGMSLIDNERARERFPLESLTKRLEYEKQARVVEKEQRGSAFLPKATQDRLAEIESWLEPKDFSLRRRMNSLHYIHASVVEQFVNSRGFGAARNFSAPSLDALDIREWDWDQIRRRGPEGPVRPYDSPAGVSAANGELWGLHERGAVDFTNPVGFGYVRDREHVAGFVPHRMRERPDPDPANLTRWSVQSVQLVSLLKFGVPRVYVSNELPAMDRVQESNTRSLDAFEEAKLGSLRQGEDVAVERNGDAIRLLGSLRATKQCLKCHDAERGDLLGAFSYHLRCVEKQPQSSGSRR